MKTNIHRVNYDGIADEKGDWWTWRETCDRCEKLIVDESVLHSTKGDNTEADFCIECMQYFMKNKISYRNAYKTFRN